jgi:hypothetical protein
MIITPTKLANIRSASRKAKVALAWGTPDKECIGYTHKEYAAVINNLLLRVQYLEDELRNNNIPFFASTDA